MRVFPQCSAVIIIQNYDFRRTYARKLLKYIASFGSEDLVFWKVCFDNCVV